MAKSAILFLFLLILPVLSFGQDVDAVHELTQTQKIKLVQTFREFARAFEKDHREYFTPKAVQVLQNMFSAYAIPGDACTVAGWISTRGAENRCQLPEDPKFSTQGCGPEQVSCNPMLFGDNLCIDFVSETQKNNAFVQCDKKFDKENRSLAKIVDQVPEDEFKAYMKEVKQACNLPSSKKLGTCREIKNKFNEYIPGDHSGNMARLQSAINNDNPGQVEKLAPKIINELKESENLFHTKKCSSIKPGDQSQADLYQECKRLHSKILKLRSLSDKAVGVLEAHALESECQVTPVEQFANTGLQVGAKTSCSPAEKQAINQNCMKDIGCVFASELAGPLLMLTDIVSKQPNSCVTSHNSCIANLMSAAIRAFLGTLKAIWELLKAGWDWVKDKAGQLWDWLSDAEDATSDAQNVVKWDPLESTCRHASLSIL